MVMSSKKLQEILGGRGRVQVVSLGKSSYRFQVPAPEELVGFVVRTMRDLGKEMKLALSPSMKASGANIQMWLREGDQWARTFSRVEDDIEAGEAKHVLQGLQGCWNIVSSKYTRARL